MMSRMGSDELAEWQAFDRIDHFEDGYYQTALICRTLHDLLGNPKRRRKLSDFDPRPISAPKKPRANPAEIFNAIDRLSLKSQI